MRSPRCTSPPVICPILVLNLPVWDTDCTTPSAIFSDRRSWSISASV
nr:hypothetical protein [Nostoc cycadae]